MFFETRADTDHVKVVILNCLIDIKSGNMVKKWKIINKIGKNFFT